MAWEMRYAHRQMAASALMNVMIAAARKAGRGLARDFGEIEQLQVSVKGPGNFVTAADHRSEDTIYKELSKARPGYGFLMEERGLVPGPDKTHRWIVDPLDGTTNFLHGIPLFSIAMALEREGEIVCGLTYNPILDELYTAEKGQGAFVNSRRLRVAARKTLSDAVISTGTPHRGKSGPREIPERMQGIDGAGERHPAYRIGRHRSGLGGVGPLRRLLRAWSAPMGHCRRDAAGAGSRRLCHRCAITGTPCSRPGASLPATRRCIRRFWTYWPVPTASRHLRRAPRGTDAARGRIQRRERRNGIKLPVCSASVFG